MDCNSKNLIYMIHCLHCNKQYIGETKRRLKERFNEHRRPVDRPTPSSRPTAVSDHFLSDNHSPNDIELIPLELIHSSCDALCKAREAYLIEKGQSLERYSMYMYKQTRRNLTLCFTHLHLMCYVTFYYLVIR